MTPEWLHQTLWFGTGILATGAFWYFLSQRNYFGALWTGFATVVAVALIVTLLIRNELIKKEQASRSYQAPTPSPDLPEKAAFEEWAAEFAATTRQEASEPVSRPSDTPKFHQAREKASPVYRQFLSDLRDSLETYRRSGYPNLYINLPEAPNDVFSADAARYTGGVIFSRDSSWTIWIKGPRQTGERVGPELQIHLMDGDGQTKGGHGVGLVTAWYNFDSETIEVRATGTGASPLAAVPKTSRAAFAAGVSALLARALTEYELKRMPRGGA